MNGRWRNHTEEDAAVVVVVVDAVSGVDEMSVVAVGETAVIIVVEALAVGV